MSYGGFEYGGVGGGGMDGGGGFGVSQGYGNSGGGFMSGDVGGMGSPPGGSGQRQNKQSITPVNIKQVLESDIDQESNPKIDGIEMQQVKLVCCIVEMEEHSTNTKYTVEDTTGRLEVKIFHSDGEGANDRNAERRARCQIGTYVRVYGNVRSWKGDRHCVSYDMEPLTEFNEITHHALETIYTHLFNTKGPLPGSLAGSGGSSGVGQPMHQVGGMNSPGFQPHGQQGFSSPPNFNQYGGGGDMGEGGFTVIQQKVVDAFADVRTDQGLSIDYVCRKMKEQGVSPNDVQQAIQFLSSEGHLYSTIDENHYRSTLN